MTLEHRLRIAVSGIHGPERLKRMEFFLRRPDLLNKWFARRVRIMTGTLGQMKRTPREC